MKNKKVLTLREGALIRESGYDYVITYLNRTGKSGRMRRLNTSPYIKGDFFEVYFDPIDIPKMTRRNLTQVPKKLADLARAVRKKR